MAVLFGLLGTVEVWRGQEPVDVGHARQRLVLAALLMDAGRVVPTDTLVDRLWGESAPQRARETLYGYVSRLRQALAGAGAAADLARARGGYRLEVAPNAVDVLRFRECVHLARSAERVEDAVRLQEEALALWRGEAFAGTDTAWFNGQRDMLEAERLAVRLDLVDRRLSLGQYDQAAAECTVLAEHQPFDERVAGQLMLALYRCGRPAGALDHYERLRHRLADELGTDPGPAIRDLHRRILDADPALGGIPDRVVAAHGEGGPSRPTPQQLPPRPAAPVGRGRELAALDRLLSGSAEEDGGLTIGVVTGVGGIGKTLLALYWAHRHADEFPEGQLFVNLRGFDATAAPLTASAALHGFLDALGVPPEEVPADLDARTGLYRSLIAGRRMLVLLDNARDADQVRPLLPGSSSCLALVTSRSDLVSLLASHRSHPVGLEVLPDGAAREVLTRTLGPDRPTAEPDAVEALVRRCAGLPLALGIVAARAAARPGLPLYALAAELEDAADRLDALSTGDLTTDVRAVFETSLRALDDRTAQIFTLLGLAPMPDMSLLAAAGLGGVGPSRTRGLLRRLEEVHLLHQHAPGRYRMHDLVRLYAVECAQRQPAGTRSAALRRLVDSYLHTAHAADRLLHPHRDPVALDPPAAGAMALPPAVDEAMSWFDKEGPCLLAVQARALENGLHRQAWQLAWTLDAFQRQRGYVRDGIAVWTTALTAAETMQDPKARATAHWLLGRTRTERGEHILAVEHLRQALALFEQIGDPAGQAHAHRTLARIRMHQDSPRQALRHAEAALRLYRTLDNPVWQANAVNAVGWYNALLGKMELAHDHCTAALALFRAADYLIGEASALDSLAYIARQAGRYGEAQEHYRQALRLCRETDNSAQVADTLVKLGAVYRELGQDADARRSWQEAAALYRAQHHTTKARQTEQLLSGPSPALKSAPAPSG
ncbi:BTAD domain-containing putative transcriptional regulator [Streptomyces phyllanthi]|uniref:Tetratricopeptide repeat protein n=1 Tax=Streptomyces phyllanthi TaxID=1803180 RepID=A0A5N8VWC0_9ACTN|nr:BTAD domain-containing putative transcriptional regulator [Streptomyces phyllanthi]MPY38996.1 tetratricopeptide repeat protein [Streptomyces phyllanthi]